VFSRILGDSLEKVTEEERRLLYVAVTRAVDKLVIFTDGKNKSPFLHDLERAKSLAVINWESYPPVRGATARLVAKVCNQGGRGGAPTFAIRDLLKASGYQWQSNGWRGWAKSFPAEGFNMELLQKELWSERADGIDVRVFDDTDAVIAQFLIDKGRWKCVTDNLPVISVPIDGSDDETRSA
jgi:DNA helicase IV